MEEGLTRRAQPGALKSFTHGVAVATREFRPDPEIVLPVAAVGSVGTFFGGLITLCAGSPDQLIWNTPTEVGIGLMAGTVGAWGLYGLYRGGRAAGRHFVERGRADLARRPAAAPSRGELTE